MTKFVLIAGLSGAGRSTATNALEDLGYFKIDNLPAGLVQRMVTMIEPGPATERVVLGLGSGGYSGEVADAIDALRESDDTITAVFLDSDTDTLVSRFEATRRPHPLEDGHSALSDLIEAERERLRPARSAADVIIDTSELNVHQTRRRLQEMFRSGDDHALNVSLVSFGFKYGLPRDVDMVLDVRFLPNPYWEPSLRSLTGRDADVRDFVLGQPEAEDFLSRLTGLLDMLVPAYRTEGKTYLTVAIGCTGGRHRSVALTNELASRSPLAAFDPTVRHRDIDR